MQLAIPSDHMGVFSRSRPDTLYYTRHDRCTLMVLHLPSPELKQIWQYDGGKLLIIGDSPTHIFILLYDVDTLIALDARTYGECWRVTPVNSAACTESHIAACHGVDVHMLDMGSGRILHTNTVKSELGLDLYDTAEGLVSVGGYVERRGVNIVHLHLWELKVCIKMPARFTYCDEVKALVLRRRYTHSLLPPHDPLHTCELMPRVVHRAVPTLCIVLPIRQPLLRRLEPLRPSWTGRFGIRVEPFYGSKDKIIDLRGSERRTQFNVGLLAGALPPELLRWIVGLTHGDA